MKCSKPGCQGHPFVTHERDATYSVTCLACKRSVKGYMNEKAAIAAFLSKYQPDDLSPAEGNVWRSKWIGVDSPEPAA